jgi:hypothetical protein
MRPFFIDWTLAGRVGSSGTALRGVKRSSLFALVAFALLGSTRADAQISGCSSCHVGGAGNLFGMTDPRMANAAGPGAGGVVTAAATHSAFGHTMPLYSDTSMPTAQSIADALLAQPGSPFVLSQTESGDFVMGISRSITVTAGSMTFTNGVGLNKLVVVPPVTGTTSLSSGSTSFTYTPSFASSSCNSQTITVRGQSASGNITTSDRTIKVNVVDGFTLATGKATADSSSTPQVVNVSSFTTLLSPAFGSSRRRPSPTRHPSPAMLAQLLSATRPKVYAASRRQAPARSIWP